MAELLEHNPYVDHIIPWERDEYEAHSKKLHLRTMWNMWWDLRKRLKPYHFDIAAVSYTHLDVYKRQIPLETMRGINLNLFLISGVARQLMSFN